MCAKRRYDSKKEAKANLRRHHDPEHTFRSCRAYYCGFCDSWHLGRLPAVVLSGKAPRDHYYAHGSFV